ncbi:uncharacterized protein LOC126672261 [Mercurialis annua]|uniref:uncharacterized protein LOC126672261 n=1 Tax=Mercurialis annua TaxID=3986 RepID=UPI0021600CB9|nr:uncharacterized protein LOC126672261 [Mercurialis annua]
MDDITGRAWDLLKYNIRINPLVDDKINWKGMRNGIFSVNSAWRNLAAVENQVSWNKVVWYPGMIPRHSFVTWLAIMGRLNTNDKLMRWGVIQSNVCSLCNTHTETIGHLYFDYSFSANIWSNILRISGDIRPENCLRREISFLTRRANERSKKSKARRLWFNAAVYHIWYARNDLVFNQMCRVLSRGLLVLWAFV